MMQLKNVLLIINKEYIISIDKLFIVSKYFDLSETIIKICLGKKKLLKYLMVDIKNR